MRTLLMLALGTALLCGCGAPALEKGRGRYWNLSEDMLARSGYPDHQHGYSSREWGLLYDEEGAAYGPHSYYEGNERLEHPYLEVTDEYLQSRWVRIYRSGCCTEALLGHSLEILDLVWVETQEQLGFAPTRLLEVFTPADLPAYREISGEDYWVTHHVEGHSILLEPVDVLFRRTLAVHAMRAAVVEAFLDLQCHGRLPPWLREGLSSYLAEEGPEHLSFMGEFRPRREILLSPEEVQEHVFPLVDRENGRIARYNAFLMVWHLSESWGWARVRELLDAVAEGASYEQAVRRVYRLEPEELLALLDPRVNGEPTTTLPPRGSH